MNQNDGKKNMKEVLKVVLMLLALPAMLLIILWLHAMIWCDLGADKACSHANVLVKEQNNE